MSIVSGMSIASFIKDDLASCILAGKGLPVQLTFDSLAEHYKVSYTPIRTAVAGLIEQGLIEKGDNRRLRIVEATQRRSNRYRAATPVAPVDHFQVIVADLVRISMSGESPLLREEFTAEKYGISRSSIRIIFHRLAAEGIIDHIPRRGWRLRAFKREDFVAFLEVREALELKALELARPRMAAAELQALLDANPFPESADEPLLWNDSLHDYLIAASNNAYIRDFFERQGRFHRQFCHLEYRDRAVGLESIRQHREIVTAMLRKNWTSARKLLSHHIRNHHPILKEKTIVALRDPA